MSSLTLKNIPDDLLNRLKSRAHQDRRSLTQEVLFLLERALEQPDPEAETARQLAQWRALAGSWQSDRTAQEEIDMIYDARSTGRNVEL